MRDAFGSEMVTIGTRSFETDLMLDMGAGILAQGFGAMRHWTQRVPQLSIASRLVSGWVAAENASHKWREDTMLGEVRSGRMRFEWIARD